MTKTYTPREIAKALAHEARAVHAPGSLAYEPRWLSKDCVTVAEHTIIKAARMGLEYGCTQEHLDALLIIVPTIQPGALSDPNNYEASFDCGAWCVVQIELLRIATYGAAPPPPVNNRNGPPLQQIPRRSKAFNAPMQATASQVVQPSTWDPVHLHDGVLIDYEAARSPEQKTQQTIDIIDTLLQTFKAEAETETEKLKSFIVKPNKLVVDGVAPFKLKLADWLKAK